MGFQIAYYSDKGNYRAVNEDALVIRTATSRMGDIVLAAVCDGMGGLYRGELASATVVSALSDWFDHSLPQLLQSGYDFSSLKEALSDKVKELSAMLEAYGTRMSKRVGTTLTMVLLLCDHCITVNVGDSRIYEVSDKAHQITKDHSVVQRELDAGRLRPEEAEQFPRKNQLYQSVGRGIGIKPDISERRLITNGGYLLCSDGLRHKLTQDEMHLMITESFSKGERAMTQTLKSLAEMAMERGEKDNITAVVVCAG